MQGIQPTENLTVFSSITNWRNTISNGGTNVNQYVSPIADNVIALVIWPRLPIGEDPDGLDLISSTSYVYDSKDSATDDPQPKTANQLPPTVQVSMITISEASAIRLDKDSTPPMAIQAALNNRFVSPSAYKDDIIKVSEKLADANVEFQVFNTSITLRESKWSDPND